MILSRRLFLRGAAGLILAGQALLAHDPHDPINAIAVSPNFAQDQTVLAYTEALTVKNGTYVLLRSTDGGIHFSPAPNVPNCDTVRKIVFSPAYSQDGTIYIAGHGGLFETTDSGTTWTLLSENPLRSLAVSPNFAKDHTLFVVSDQNAIRESTDGGNTWTILPTPAGLASTLDVIVVSPNYSVDKTLLLGGGNKDGIYESADGGASWTQAN